MSRVTFEKVVKRYGEVTALRQLDLEIREGEFLTLLGPSGCGKTTTLRLIAGFILPTSGTILLGDDDITHLPPQKREIGMVFQDYALFPHMTVAENVAFGLVERRHPKDRIRRRIGELLDLVKLPGMGERYPAELSGGQQQRVAVARAVAHTPRVLLMDEPLGALDLKLREAMQMELRRIQRELAITTVYVTHDQGEAINMSDRIAVMNQGEIEQVDTAEAIYRQPRSRFVADFVGQINFLEAAVVGGDDGWSIVEAAGGRLRAPAAPGRPVEGRVTLAVRPEALKLMPAGAQPPDKNALPGKIAGRSFAGNLIRVFVDVGGGTSLTVEGRPDETVGETGERVVVAWDPKDGIVLAD
jgi:spermidine/putrescine ABC transporter ATP-binding subunit